MAEGEKSTNLARKMVCNICGLEGQKRYAIYFCRQCQKNFCIDCRNNHLKTQETHSHVLVEREVKMLLLSDNSTLEDEMINLSALTLSSVPPEAPLCIEHEHECKYFCKVHMVELCLLCKGTDHKNCDEVIDFKEAVEHVYSQSDDDKVTNVLKQLTERFDRCKASADESKFKLTTKGDVERTEIRQIRQRIDRYLDSLEAKALAETDEVIDTERKALDERINSCNSSISLFAAYVINLNNVKSRGSNTEKFMVRNRVTKDIKQYSMLLDLFEDKSASGEKLVQNKKFKNLYDLSKIIEKMTTPRANSSTRNITNEPVTIPPEERNSQQLGPMVQVVPTINPVPAEGNVFAPIGIPPIGLAPVWQTLRPAQPAISSPIQVILQPSQARQTGPTIDPAAIKEVQMRSDSMNVIPVIRSSPTKPTIVTEMPRPVPTCTIHNGMKDFHTRSNNRTALQSSTNKIFALDQEPLTAFMLAAVPPQEQKQMLGERLFPKIQRMQPDLAEKVTGMLLQIDNSELLQMLESHMSLRAKVEEAVAVLKAHQAKVNNQVKDITQNQQASQPHLNKTLVVQNLRDPLTASMLAAAPPQEQKQMLGERLYPFIRRMHPDLAGKITGMLLEMDNSELLRMLESSDSLKLKVEEAVAILQAHQAKESAHQLAKAMY